MNYQGRLVCAVVVAALSISGCKRSEGGKDGTKGTTVAASASHKSHAPVDPFPPAPRGEVFVDGVTMQSVDVGAKKEVRYSGSIHNTTEKPIDGVQLNITLATAAGAGVGGQTTEFYFQPALAAKHTAPLNVQLPGVTLPAGVGQLAAKIDVLQVLKSKVPAQAQSTSPAATPAGVTAQATPPAKSAALSAAKSTGAKGAPQ